MWTFLLIAGILLCSQQMHAQLAGPVPSDFVGSSSTSAGPDVNGFTGAFGFNLPLLTVPGPEGSSYTISMSYNSGASANSEVSWVGYGWTLNAGSIVRNTHGLPDDWKDTLIRWNKVKRNWTVSATTKRNLEVLSYDKTKDADGDDNTNDTLLGGFGLDATLRYNSYTGFSHASGIGAFVEGKGGLSYAVDRGESSFSAVLDINTLLSAANTNPKEGSSSTAAKVKSPFNTNIAGPLSAGLNSLAFPREVSYPLAGGVSYEGASTNFSASFLASVPAIGMGFEYGASGTHTYQDSKDSTHLPAYGYMYSGLARYDPIALMDYSVEKNIPYRKEDETLPIPFSSADSYYRFGTDVGGGFRMYNRSAGIFRPNAITSGFLIIQAGLDITGVGRWGIGGRLGVGMNSHSEGAWKRTASQYSFAVDGDEPYFFRMAGDRGGYTAFGSDDQAKQAAIDIDLFNPWSPLIPSSVYPQINNGSRSGRSTYIGFNTIAEMNLKTEMGVRYRSYNKDRQSIANVDLTRDKIKSSIGEIAIDDPNGYRYVYGLPLYARNEKNLTLGLPFLATDQPGQVHYNYLAHDTLTEDTASHVQGEERAAPYVAAHLLTAITTPDYIDRTNNGPTVDDFGGYTRFTYRQPYDSRQKDRSSSDFWFRWRSPYTGFLFNKGDLSDPSDDVGSYSTGEREVYQLQTVETKTHVAIFVTNATHMVVNGRVIRGSLSEREDAYSPYLLQSDSRAQARAAGDSNFTGAARPPAGWFNRQTRLERIELYTRNSAGEPDSLLQTVYLEHDYSLRPNMPNSMTVAVDSTTRHGMLTLKKVWVQNQNVVHSRINPYEFGYEYRQSSDYPSSVQSKYPEITQFADSLSAAEQNPAYSPYDFDSWGNYQYRGASRQSRMRRWVNQVPDTSSFDPAAWQLKWIRTPSQNEIQVQYEQNDYAYVQDRPAMGMVSLRRSFGSEKVSSDSETDNRYYLNLADLGIDTTSYREVAKLKTRIASQYLGKNRKIYFRFLYALKGDTARFYQSDYNSDYISGYASVAEVGIDTVTGGSTYFGLYLKLKEDGDEEISVPKQVCLDYVEKRKRGMLSRTPALEYRPDNAPAMIWDLLSLHTSADAYFDAANHCKAIDYDNSYIRVPLTRPKKGGGIRVKRLLSLNGGTEGDTTLNGTEYLYDVDDDQYHERTSSGVAVNEPAVAREENALVDLISNAFLHKTRDKVIAGDDLGRFEGPRGESLLPGASVGYSRVIAKSIYSGRTAPGFGISEYLTARDYPFDFANKIPSHGPQWTSVIEKPIEVRPFWSPFAFFRLNIDYLWLTQGYRFILNDMHGKPKTSSVYGGNYEDRESWFLSGSTTVDYYEPGEAVPIAGDIGDPVVLEKLGQTMEVVMESRSVTDSTMDAFVEGDVNLFTLAFSGKGYASINDNLLRSHVTTKVTHYPAFTKSVLTYADGQYSVARTLAFDRQTGSPLISTTSDGYDRLRLDTATSSHRGQYHTFGVPGHLQFERMGQKAINERAIIRTDTSGYGLQISKNIVSGTHSLAFWAPVADSNSKYEIARLGPGDLIKLTLATNGSYRGLYHVRSRSGNVVELLPLSTTTTGVNGDTGRVDVQVIRSGRANQLNASVGGIATYGLTDSIVRTGAFITRVEPAGFADRLDLRNELRSLLLGTKTKIVAADLPAGLQLISKTNTCAALQDSIKITSLSGNRLLVTTPRGDDILYFLDSTAHFELEDDGTIAFYASATALVPQRLTMITFCPETNPVRQEIDGVLSAGASMLEDSTDYSTAEYTAPSYNSNSYEIGKRGKWRSRAAYGYRTNIVPGGEYWNHQRVYRNAGLYEDFTLFNWRNPEANDPMKWIRGDSVVRYSPHGVPLETRSPLDVYSAVRMGYDDHLPHYIAVNARYTAIAFQDYENLAPISSPASVVRGVAHTGNSSLRLIGPVVSAASASVTADPQIVANGLLVNVWARFSRYGLDTTDPLSITITSSGSSYGTVNLTSNHTVAETGEWTLYEVLLTTPAPVNGSNLVLSVSSGASGGDTVWVDDIRMMPGDAEMVCHVYDTETLRPMASLDADHFAAFNQYNAEGRTVRTIVETARGVRTVAETHANLPGVSRVPGEPIDSLPPVDTKILRTRNVGGAFALDEDEMLNHSSSSELLGVTFDGTSAPDVKVLGSDLAALEAAFKGNDLVLADRWLRIQKEYDSLSVTVPEAPDAPALQAQREERLREIEKQQDRILRQLGISRKEMEALIEPRDSSEQ